MCAELMNIDCMHASGISPVIHLDMCLPIASGEGAYPVAERC